MSITREQARGCLETMMTALQRVRSIEREACPTVSESTLALLSPWLFGKKCPLGILEKLLARDFSPLDFYNMMTVLTFMPVVAAYAESIMQTELPEPNPEWLRGFEEALR